MMRHNCTHKFIGKKKLGPHEIQSFALLDICADRICRYNLIKL